jgi:hypothetical protein
MIACIRRPCFASHGKKVTQDHISVWQSVQKKFCTALAEDLMVCSGDWLGLVMFKMSMSREGSRDLVEPHSLNTNGKQPL